MRPLDEAETTAVFEKLLKFMGNNLKNLVENPAHEGPEQNPGRYCFRLQKNRVFYVSESLVKRATNISRKNLVAMGICVGRFTHVGKFHLTVQCLNLLAANAKHKVWLKPTAEMSFLYGNHVLKGGVGRITDSIAPGDGVVVFSMSDIPLGFGNAAKSTQDSMKLDPNGIVVHHQSDIGHTYLTYGPLLNGVTNVLFGSTPAHPDAGRCWRIVEKYNVRVLYTAPTLIRSLMQFGDHWVTEHDRSSLRILGTVGEPINPHAWEWYHQVVGEGRCPIVDTWWQTETGAAMITPLPYAWDTKPGSATLPFFGVQPVLLTDKGEEISGPGEGILAVKAPWPSMMRTVYGDHARFEQTYFSAFKGYYFTGDGCRRDEDGYYWITGRVDDVINVSGHRVGTAEVESALTSHEMCAEAAVIGVPHAVKGEALYAYVTLLEEAQPSAKLHAELVNIVKTQIGSFAAPDVIHWAPGLPKTRSGKIMRRILRKIATDQLKEIGDTSTLAEPQVVDQLIASRPKVLAKL